MSIIDATRPGNVHSADGWGDVLNIGAIAGWLAEQFMKSRMGL